ncbi:MAG: DUF499 domain-containing protein [candidate division KSB1 bacterium]|nr:DUF499 domain-containing protein [candidate division KSB1 bacterium]
MMKSWTQVVTPHIDIRTGKLDESVFAADLSDVVAERGPLEYRDAATFFRKTYPTQGLLNLLAAMRGRLSGVGSGEAVIQIQTPFGGGKTHSLIALYHFIKHGDELSDSGAMAEILERAGAGSVPKAAVVTFVGTNADPLKGRTPWGELAQQLGRYDLLQEHDKKRRAPGKDLLHNVLSAQPTLILMDEIAEYAVKAKDFRDQVVAFYQELTETVKVLPHAALVVTLPSSAPYGEDGERALHELQQVFKRVESIKTPVEGEEIYEVIRRRLFEDTGDPQEIRRAAEEFFELYRQQGDDLPKEVREPAYRDRMRKAYPFHPELIDVLFERWSTFTDFQRTRGVLRLLGQLVSELYQAQHPAPVISPAHLTLTNPAVRGEFLRHIGNEYQGVIASDIAGPNAKAERMDREMGSEYARFGVAGGLARAIFFASFSGSEKRGVGIQRLRLALLQPGLPPAIIADALRRLEEELWYLHVESGSYQFSSQPNLNRVLVEKEEAVPPEQITEEMRARLEKLAGSELRVTLWPQTSQDVPDTKELKLAMLSPEHTRKGAESEAFARELLEKCGQTFRTYRNTLLLLTADAAELASARQQIKRYLAYRAIRDDKALLRQLSEENKNVLNNKLKDAEGGIAHQLLSAYRHLAKADEHGIRWLDLGLPTVGARPSLAHRVREYLRGEDLLLAKISPRRILEKALNEAEQEKPVDEIYEAFLRYPNLPMLERKEVLLEAMAQGAQEGTFGVRIGERVFFRERPSLSESGAEAILVREPGVPDQPSSGTTGEEQPGTQPTPKVAEGGGEPTQPAAMTTRTIHAYHLQATIPWDKFSEFVRGVVMPLRQDEAELKIEVRLEARAEGGIKQSTLEQKVRETLRQIGATNLEEKVE